MNTINLLTAFWQKADFAAFSDMYDSFLPGRGESYKREKFIKFQDNLAFWLCDLTENNRQLVELYLIDLQISKEFSSYIYDDFLSNLQYCRCAVHELHSDNVKLFDGGRIKTGTAETAPAQTNDQHIHITNQSYNNEK